MIFQNRLDASVVLPQVNSEDIDEVKARCNQMGIKTTLIRSSSVAADLKKWYKLEKPNLCVVMTFPYMIPKNLLELEGSSWFNFHFALLPQYRGAEPIFWVLKNQELVGGITVHKMTKDVDAGPIVLQREIPIDTFDTHGSHMSKLEALAPQLLYELLTAFRQNPLVLTGKPQNKSLAKTYPRAALSDLLVNWKEMEAVEIEALVRASNPWNKGAIAFINKMPVRLIEVQISEKGNSEKLQIGEIYELNNHLVVRCLGEKDLVIGIVYLNEGYLTGIRFRNMYRVSGLKFD
jgi:methionyl-tRNA formyltransferase